MSVISAESSFGQRGREVLREESLTRLDQLRLALSHRRNHFIADLERAWACPKAFELLYYFLPFFKEMWQKDFEDGLCHLLRKSRAGHLELEYILRLIFEQKVYVCPEDCKELLCERLLQAVQDAIFWPADRGWAYRAIWQYLPGSAVAAAALQAYAKNM